MESFELIAPCHFGLEAVLKKEITDLGYDVSNVDDGRVTFVGDNEAIARVNVWSRTAERVLVKLGSFHAESFEELFQDTKALPLEKWIPADGKFWVAKAASVKSKLFSPSDNVFCEPIKEHASAIVLCHNHPSGMCHPSPTDISTTEDLVQVAGLLGNAVLDHIILTRHGYYSLLEHNELPVF